MLCRQGSNGASGCCTTRLENTHGTEIWELLYPWHPWFGLRVAVHEAIDKSDGIVFRCSLSGSDAGRWLEVPAWMFDRSACGRACIATDAHGDLAALTRLATLLRHVLNDQFASSNAPLSGASRLSRDQNLGRASMPRQTKPMTARRRAPQQIDLFAGRVEMWRSGCRLSIAVSAPFVWRCLSGSALTSFPHLAHRTGHADFPHPALGQDFTPSPTARRAQARLGVRARSAHKGARVDRSRPCIA